MFTQLPAEQWAKDKITVKYSFIKGKKRMYKFYGTSILLMVLNINYYFKFSHSFQFGL